MNTVQPTWRELKVLYHGFERSLRDLLGEPLLAASRKIPKSSMSVALSEGYPERLKKFGFSSKTSNSEDIIEVNIPEVKHIKVFFIRTQHKLDHLSQAWLLSTMMPALSSQLVWKSHAGEEFWNFRGGNWDYTLTTPLLENQFFCR